MSDQALQIKISTVAELSALRDLERELQKAVVGARTLGATSLAGEKEKELVKVQAALGKFTLGDKIQAETKDFVEKIPILGEGVRALNGAFGFLAKGAVVAAGALELARKAIDEYAAQEADVAKLNQALANSGQYSAEASAEVQELANKFKELTGIDDAKFIGVARVLLQFGAKREELDKYTEAVVNLAGIMGGDVEGAAQMMGKAMQGSTEMLGRYGIRVDAAATQTEKMDSILRQAADRGAGQLTAGAETLARKFHDVRLGVDDAFKGFGNLIARSGVVQAGLDVMAGGLKLFNKLLPETVDVAGKFANKLGGVAKSAEEVAAQLKLAEDAGKKLADTKLTALNEAAVEATAKFAALVAQIRAAEQAQIALNDAKLARDLSAVDEEESSGRMSASDAASARYGLKTAAASEKTRLELESNQGQKAEEGRKVGLKDAEASRAGEVVRDLEGKGARAKDAGSVAERKKEQDLLDQVQARQARQAEMEKLKAELSAAHDAASGGTEANWQAKVGPLVVNRDKKIAEGKQADADYEARQEAFDKQIAEANKQVGEIKAALAVAKPAAAEAWKAAETQRGDSAGKVGVLDIQGQSLEAVAKENAAAAANAQKDIARKAAEKTREDEARKAAKPVLDKIESGTDQMMLDPKVNQAGRDAARKLHDMAASAKNDPNAKAMEEVGAGLRAFFEASGRKDDAAVAGMRELWLAVEAGRKRALQQEEQLKNIRTVR